MKHQKNKALALSIALIVLLILGYANRVGSVNEFPVKQAPEPQKPVPTLSHAQMVWSYALEWCESRGLPGAINPLDRDNTPSYGGYQFKPGTLSSYAKIYAVAASSSVMDYPTQRLVLEAMILDREHIDWHQQFPDCVKRLGLPPRKMVE